MSCIFLGPRFIVKNAAINIGNSCRSHNKQIETRNNAWCTEEQIVEDIADSLVSAWGTQGWIQVRS